MAVNWNPDDKRSSVTLSNNNLTMTSTQGSARANISKAAGKWYWEILMQTLTNGGNTIGIGTGAANINYGPGFDGNAYAYANGGQKANGNSYPAYGAAYLQGDVIGVALDLDAGTLTFYKNGVSQGEAFSGLSGTFFPMCGNSGGSESYTATFKPPFAYTLPSGFSPLEAGASPPAGKSNKSLGVGFMGLLS